MEMLGLRQPALPASSPPVPRLQTAGAEAGPG